MFKRVTVSLDLEKLLMFKRLYPGINLSRLVSRTLDICVNSRKNFEDIYFGACNATAGIVCSPDK